MYYTQLEVVKLLVESGANVNHRDNLGATVLFWATGKISIYLSMCNVHISFFCQKGFLDGFTVLCFWASSYLLLSSSLSVS